MNNRAIKVEIKMLHLWVVLEAFYLIWGMVIQMKKELYGCMVEKWDFQVVDLIEKSKLTTVWTG